MGAKLSKVKSTSLESVTFHRPHYSRWRAATLIGVYVLMTIHVLHWQFYGTTLAPLELNEVMYTFELGIVTAGFIFMAFVLLATAIFGRFFCSWGCHILALQDLSSWILGKLQIKPMGIRSRLLLGIPLFAAFYMFAWPQVVRVAAGRPMPITHITTDDDGWASFTTENFWRNLPGVGIIITTFVVCGFVMVYILGSRGFCMYACPYGALFGIVDRIAPGRIRIGEDCTQCGTCTSVCSSHVRVHEELARFGTVIDSACMKDLDCVSACPQQSLHYGFGLPSVVQLAKSESIVHKRYDFTLWEEAMMAVVFVVLLPIFRGLYDAFPFLLSIALACIGAYLSVVLIRLRYRSIVKFNRWPLKMDGRFYLRGKLFVAVMLGLILFTAQSGMAHYYSFQGRRHFLLSKDNQADHQSASLTAIDYLECTGRWGMVRNERDVAILAELYIKQKDWEQARRQIQWFLDRDPTNPGLHIRMGKVLNHEGNMEAAQKHLQHNVMLNPDHAESHYALAGIYFDSGFMELAANHLYDTIRLHPDHEKALYDLGALLVETGRMNEGIKLLHRCIELNKSFADAHYNLSVALAISGKNEEAMAEIETARKLNPNDEQTIAFHELLIKRSGISKR